MSDKKLWKFHWDCGRMGDVHGSFIATDEEIKKNIGREVNFGPVLDKHSEVYGTLDEEDLEVISSNPEVVENYEKISRKIFTGHNPLEYIEGYWDESESE